MAILKYPNQSGIVYAYDSVSVWDPVKKQSRSVRKCLGRVDPETGEIIPSSGKRGRPKKNTEDDLMTSADSKLDDLNTQLDRMKNDYNELLRQNRILTDENKKLRLFLSRFINEASSALGKES